MKTLLSLRKILLLVAGFMISPHLQVYGQTTRFEAESTTNWVESFGPYTHSWAAHNDASLSGGSGYRASGSSSDCSGTRGKYILFSNMGLPAGAYNIDLQWMDINAETLSEMWFFVGERDNPGEPPVTAGQPNLKVNDHWFADQTNGGIYVRSYTNINLTTTDTIFIFACAKGGSTRSVIDYIDFTPAGNPNPPAVNNQTFSTSECSTPGTVVGTVAASDADGHYPLTYSITSGNTGGVFTINGSTGQIIVNGTLDFETTPSYALTVQVDDSGLPIESSTATITVNINDCTNEFFPTINNQTFSVNENSPNGTTVGTVTASDTDGNALTYSITGGNLGNVFSINSSTGAITVNGSLNFETNPSYPLTVQVCDNGTPSRCNSATVTVNLNNVNENPNPPVINNQTFSVNENSPNGTSVGTVAASDPDGHSLTYSITAGNTGNVFSINPITGAITVNGILDYEAISSYPLTVQVTDNGEPSKSSTATITVNINNLADANVNPPVIINQTFTVDENSGNGFVVGTVVASDPDWYQTLSYAITAGGAGKFTINPTTGQITVIGALDFETTSSYTLTVRASDNGSPSLNSSATITINLTNVDESGVFPFIQRKVWDGPYDIKMIAAPNHEAVFLDPDEAENGNLLADSVIEYSTMLMSGTKLDINNRYKGGSPFVQVSSLNLPSVLCPDPNSPCYQGLELTSPNSSCPVRYTSSPPTIDPDPYVSMTYADYDDDPTTFSSSMAQLDISECSEIEAAYLYWTGMFKGSNPSITLLDGPLNSYSGDGSTVFNTSSGFAGGHNSVKFKIPGGSYQTVVASGANTRNTSSRYLCVADVTSMVQGTGGGQFWVGNIQSYPNEGDGGSTSGWVLIVVFRSPLSPPRRISLWDGLESIDAGDSKTLTLTGIQAPATGNFNSFMGFCALDGENIAAEISSSSREGLGFQTNAGGSYVEINPFATDQPPYRQWTSKGFPAQSNGTTDNKDGCNFPLFDANWGLTYDGVSSMRITTYDEVTGLNGNEIVRLPGNPRTLGLDAHHMKLPPGAVASGATTATITVKAGPQGSTIPFLAYVAIERLQPKLVMDKIVDKNTTPTNSQVTYTLTIKNEGNAASLGGDRIYDTLDIATDYLPASLTSTRYVNGVATTPAPGVSLVSSAGDNLEFNLANSIAVGDSVRITFTVQIKDYAGNTTLWDVECKRTIINTAYARYNTASSGILETGSNSDDCGIGSETRVLVMDALLGSSGSTVIGPINACSFLNDQALPHIEQALTDAGIPASILDEYDIRDELYNRVQTTDSFPTTSPFKYYAIRDFVSGGSCQEIYEIQYEAPCVLPVTLISFTGWKNGAVHTLRWITSSEKNNQYFIIERSSNGVDFEAMDMISGNGNSETEKIYLFDDKNPLQGTNYYRLKQVDHNGAISYSNIIRIENDSNVRVDIYPNPNDGTFTISFSSGEQSFKLDITDINGRTVYTLSGEKLPANLEINDLAKGMYIVKLSLENEELIKKLVIY